MLGLSVHLAAGVIFAIAYAVAGRQLPSGDHHDPALASGRLRRPDHGRGGVPQPAA